MKQKTDGILSMIQAQAAALNGEVSLSAKALHSGKRIDFNPNRRVGTASVIKLPILAAALQAIQEGNASLDETITVKAEDKVIGSGLLQHLGDKLQIPLKDVLLMMIIISDNTATNLVIDRFGLEEINRRFKTLGLQKTALHKYVFKPAQPSTKDSEKFGLGVTTPREMVDLLERIAKNRLLGEEYDRIALEILSKQELKNGIPRFLSSDWTFAGKSGSVDSMRNDVGVVTLPDGQQIALAIFCQKLTISQWTPENPGQLMIARLAEIICANLIE